MEKGIMTETMSEIDKETAGMKKSPKELVREAVERVKKAKDGLKPPTEEETKEEAKDSGKKKGKAKAKKKEKTMVVAEPQDCQCGALLSPGAVLCGVCKALYDRDKKKAKAKAKGKGKKAKKAFLTDEVMGVIHTITDSTLIEIGEAFPDTSKEEGEIIVAQIAYLLNKSLTVKKVKVSSTFQVKNNESGEFNYRII